jgi:hypothetical protein
MACAKSKSFNAKNAKETNCAKNSREFAPSLAPPGREAVALFAKFAFQNVSPVKRFFYSHN